MILTSTSAIFSDNPIIVVESVFFAKKIQAAPLIYKKAGVVSRLISLGSYLIKLVTLFLRIKGINITFFSFYVYNRWSCSFLMTR